MNTHWFGDPSSTDGACYASVDGKALLVHGNMHSRAWFAYVNGRSIGRFATAREAKTAASRAARGHRVDKAFTIGRGE